MKRFRARTEVRPRDFEQLFVLGEGSFGRVTQVRVKGEDPCAVFALKEVKKGSAKGETMRSLANEARVHSQLDHPFLARLIRTFQCPRKVYFLIEFVPGGELRCRLRNEGRFSEEVGLFYAGELLLALHYLHSNDTVFRDLKPENLLIDARGHLKLIDFGFAKTLDCEAGRAHTLCGTAAYMAPEMLLKYKREGYAKSVDWWAFGVILFEMLTGEHPFDDEDPQKVYAKIIEMRFALPRHLSASARSLLSSLLTRCENRLGVSDNGESIMQHDFFAGVSFEEMLKKECPAPWKPEPTALSDARHFGQQTCLSRRLLTENQDDPFEDF